MPRSYTVLESLMDISRRPVPTRISADRCSIVFDVCVYLFYPVRYSPVCLPFICSLSLNK